MVRFGKDFMGIEAGLVAARSGVVWRGLVRLGLVGSGRAWQGFLGLERQGSARCGSVFFGSAGHGRARISRLRRIYDDIYK